MKIDGDRRYLSTHPWITFGFKMDRLSPATWKVILGVSWVISGRRYDDGPPPWGIMGVKETSP